MPTLRSNLHTLASSVLDAIRAASLEETSESGAKAEGAAATQKTDRDH